MPLLEPAGSPSAVGRKFLGAATVLTAVLGLTGDARWFAASGAFGIAWWAWDFIWDNVLGPLGAWFTGALTGVADVEEPPDLSVDDTIRLLEGHLAADGVTRHVQIQSALRLAEIYRLNKKDPGKAHDVIERVRAKWPDAPELELFEKSEGDRSG
jgi:hypothetical protein